MKGKIMKILVTGAKGFIGKNLIAELKNENYNDIYECDKDTTAEELEKYTSDCEFVFHLAGVNRPENNDEFMKGNFGFTSQLLNLLKNKKNKCPIMIASSIQAALNNPYGVSKKAGEDLMFKYGKENDVKVLVYRFENVFGKWCRPNYNSVIATFCNNIAIGEPIKINDTEIELHLIYIDDLVAELIRGMQGNEHKNGEYCSVRPVYIEKLGHIAKLIESFKDSRNSDNLQLPNMEDEFSKKLYSTYLSYIPENDFAYDLKMNIDNRGSFTEMLKTKERGQISVNISHPGIVKGNHWHNTKNEKFIVVYGTGIIRFRKIDSDKVIEYKVSGDKLQVVDIPCGYTHNIENVGETDMITIMWANEIFNPNKPDTYTLNV